MPNPDLEADCAKCFGLCCIALRFARSDGFGHDKAAGSPCHLLTDSFRCSIHPRLDALGYEGCTDFDCFGAGQRAPAAFAATNWQRDPATARTLYAHFATLLTLQESRAALIDAGNMALKKETENQRKRLLTMIEAAVDHGTVNQVRDNARELGDMAKEIIEEIRQAG